MVALVLLVKLFVACRRKKIINLIKRIQFTLSLPLLLISFGCTDSMEVKPQFSSIKNCIKPPSNKISSAGFRSNGPLVFYQNTNELIQFDLDNNTFRCDAFGEIPRRLFKTHDAIKMYDAALIYVDKALKVSPGNQNALTSKKYMYLGYAYQKQQAQNYDAAERLLKDNLALFKDDKDTLLNLANLYLIAGEFDKAETTYNTIANTPENKTLALNGLALVKHLKGKEKEALNISEEAYNTISNLNDATYWGD